MKIEFDMTMDDFRKSQKEIDAVLGKKNLKIKVYGVYIGIYAVIMLILNLRGWNIRGTIGVTAMYIFAIMSVRYLNREKFFKKIMNSDYIGKHVIKLSEDRIADKMDKRNVFFRWRTIRGIEETKTHVYVIIKDNQYVAIPKRAIEENQKKEFINTVEKYMQQQSSLPEDENESK